MFGWFRRKPQSHRPAANRMEPAFDGSQYKADEKIDLDSVRVLCERHLEEVLKEAKKHQRHDGKLSIDLKQILLHSDDFVNMWRRHFYPEANKVFATRDTAKQRIDLRVFLLDSLENAAPHRAFLWTGIAADQVRNGEESAILMGLWDKDASDLEDATFQHVTFLAVLDCCIEIARWLQGLPPLNDSHPDDYFEFFRRLVTQLWFLTVENNIAISSAGGPHWRESFIAPLKEKIAQVRADVMTGEDIRYPPEALSAPEATDPDPVPDLTTSQVEALVDTLTACVHRLSKGELYLLDGRPPSDIAAAFSVETAMMLIGLRECIGNDLVADGALRAIIMRAQRQMLPPDQQARSASDVDLMSQTTIADFAKEQESEGWMTKAGTLAAAAIHPEAYAANQSSPEQRYAWGATCLPILQDMWTPYAITLRQFGRNFPEQFLGVEPPASRSPIVKL